MIKARHTYTGHLVASLYSGYKLDQAFQSVNLSVEPADSQLPVLLVANHFC